MHLPVIENEILDNLAETPTGFTVDAMTRLGYVGWLDGITTFGGKANLAGRARTLSFARRNDGKTTHSSIYTVMRGFGPGDVVVAAVNAGRHWILGENVAHEALYCGVNGVLTDACVRDAIELKQMDFAIFAAGVSVIPPFADLVLEAIDVPVTLAGTRVHAGDLIHADSDGALVVSHSVINKVVFQINDIAKIEDEQEQAIRSRASLDIIGDILRRKKTLKP